MGSAVSDVYII